MLDYQASLQMVFLRVFFFSPSPHLIIDSQIEREGWHIREVTLNHIWEERGQEKKRWSLDSWSQNIHVGDISELNLCCLAWVDSLSRISNQQINECLSTNPLNHMRGNQLTLGLECLKKFQVDPKWHCPDFEGSQEIVTGREVMWTWAAARDWISNISEDLAGGQTH